MTTLYLIGGLCVALALLIWGAVAYGRRSAEKDTVEKSLDDAKTVAEEKANAARMSDDEMAEERKKWQKRPQ